MAVKCVFAAIDERGELTGGKAGDQNSKEVMIAPYYQFGQNIVLRPKTKALANKMVSAGKWLANSDLVGYDMSNRTGLYKAVQKVGFKDYRKLKDKCETDCSAFIAVLVNIAGFDVPADMWTGNMKNELLKTEKFELLTDTKYLISDEFLKKGDIVLNEDSHVVLVCEDGEAADGSKSYEPVYFTVIPVNGLNLRANPTTKAPIEKILKKGTVVVLKKREGAWYKIECNGRIGYVLAKFLAEKK